MCEGLFSKPLISHLSQVFPIRTVKISLFILIVPIALALSGAAFAEEPADVISSKPDVVQEETTEVALSKPDDDTDFQLSLHQFIDLVVERNQRVEVQDAELEIKREQVNAARSIYEPVLVGAYNYNYKKEQNDSSQFASRGFQETYEQEVNAYKLEIDGLALPGTQYQLGFALNETEDDISDVGIQYRQLSYINLTQPLLKNAGIKTTDTPVRIAKKDVEIARQNYRRELLNTIGQAIVVYWDLSMAQQKLDMRQESVRVANEILEDNKVRFKTGKMAEVEVLEAEAGVALRKALEMDARKKYVSALSDALTMFSEHASNYLGNVNANEPLQLENGTYSYLGSVREAFTLRPEYLAAKERILQEEIRLEYARNQRWPELDLKASYGLNGLDTDRSGAWDNMADDEYYSWSVGLELRVPLFGDRKSKSEEAQVKQRKRKALFEMKAIEVALANAVDTSIKNIESATEEAKYSARVADFNKKLLEVELVRLSAGKSNSRMVLEKEEDFRSAKEAELESLVNQKKAILQLEMARGSLLSRYNKDVLLEGI